MTVRRASSALLPSSSSTTTTSTTPSVDFPTNFLYTDDSSQHDLISLGVTWAACGGGRRRGREGSSNRTSNHKGSNVCPICGRISRDAYDNKKHIRTHTGEKPYECSLCDYRAVTKGQVLMHMISKHKSNDSSYTAATDAS